MGVALVIVIATIGVMSTIFCAVRMWRAARSGAPRELVLGYLALMVFVSVVSTMLIRLV